MPDDANPQPPDLDLISLVQRARMVHDADAMPSQVAAVYWIEAKPEGDTPAPTLRAGYWRITTTLDAVDTLWAAIKAATQAGTLGYKSKVATVSRDANPNSRVIHVMTYDADDTADVERVRNALEALGITDAEYVRD